MAGKPKSMSQIKQLLLLHQQGKGKKTIASLLGMSRATVKVYLQKLQLLTSSAKGTKPFSVAELVKLEDPVLEAKFHPGNPAYKDGRYETFSTNLGYYLKELKRTGVTNRLLWEEYRQQYPNGYGYSQFCYHLQ
jgi:transposase